MQASWTVSQGTRVGKPIFVRCNVSAKSLAKHSDYRFRVGVAVPLKAPNEDGLPTNDEMEQLNTLEDQLCDSLEQQQESLQVLSITTQGMREFVFYTRNPELARNTIEELRATTKSHEIQGYVAEDKKWSVYAEFA